MDAISGLDIQGRILSWNRGAEEMLGYKVEEVLGRHFEMLIPAELLEDGLLEDGELERLETMFQEKGAIRDYATRRRHKDGREFQVVLSRTALRDEVGGLIGYSSILRDVTEESWLREKIQQTEKLSAIGQLAAGLAHEIGGPLSVISGNAEFLLEGLDADDPGREDVEGIASECDAVAVLIRRLLDFSRPAKLETRPVDVNETLRNVLLLVRKHIVKENIAIKLDLQVGLPPLSGDPNQLEQVVMNLVLNARNAMPEGGRLEIRSFRAHSLDGNNRRKVAIEIADSGVGIPKESLGRIFEPYFTTRNRGEGTGLGLAISQRIVTDHQGEISVRSRIGGGTTFTIELPSINEEAG
jgi:PAS domain S-box-containing protein